MSETTIAAPVGTVYRLHHYKSAELLAYGMAVWVTLAFRQVWCSCGIFTPGQVELPADGSLRQMAWATAVPHPFLGDLPRAAVGLPAVGVPL